MSKKIDLSNSQMWQSLDWDEKSIHPNLKRTDAQVNRGRANKLKAQNPKFQETMTLVQSSSEYKESVSKTSIEHWQDPTYRKKNSKGKKKAWAIATEERRQQVVEQFSQPKTEKHKRNIARSQKAFYQTEEGKKVLQQKSLKQKGKPKPKFTCPHCNEVGGPIMKRWHFDNCKHKGENK